MYFKQSVFVRISCDHAFKYIRDDKNGDFSTVTPAEGGGQGDPLMLLLFCRGMQSARAEISSQLFPGDTVFASMPSDNLNSPPPSTSSCAPALATNEAFNSMMPKQAAHRHIVSRPSARKPGAPKVKSLGLRHKRPRRGHPLVVTPDSAQSCVQRRC